MCEGERKVKQKKRKSNGTKEFSDGVCGAKKNSPFGKIFREGESEKADKLTLRYGS